MSPTYMASRSGWSGKIFCLRMSVTIALEGRRGFINTCEENEFMGNTGFFYLKLQCYVSLG